jgi:hypothetical protein
MILSYKVVADRSIVQDGPWRGHKVPSWSSARDRLHAIDTMFHHYWMTFTHCGGQLDFAQTHAGLFSHCCGILSSYHRQSSSTSQFLSPSETAVIASPGGREVYSFPVFQLVTPVQEITLLAETSLPTTGRCHSITSF